MRRGDDKQYREEMKREIIWFETFSEQIVLDEKEAFYQMNCDKTLKIVLTKGIGVEPL